MSTESKICVGQIAGAHGVQGFVRLKSFTEDPYNIFDYKPLTDESGKRVFNISQKKVMNDHFVVAVDGVKDREAAQALGSVKLYIARSLLPKPKRQEYYQSDLIGLKALDKDGRVYGIVMSVHDYGAGPFIEIGISRRDSFMLPFTNVCVPDVDLKAGTVIISPPEGWLNKDEKEDSDHAKD
jgi:16S rRNA processing protein RimM